MKVETIITVAFALFFVITGLFAIFSAGTILNIGLERVIGVEDCRVDYPRDVSDIPGIIPEERCEFDTNRAKKDAARAVTTLLVTVPAAWYSYRGLKRS